MGADPSDLVDHRKGMDERLNVDEYGAARNPYPLIAMTNFCVRVRHQIALFINRKYVWIIQERVQRNQLPGVDN